MQVRVKRAGLHVRARSGSSGTTTANRRPVPRTRQAQSPGTGPRPLGGGALNLRLTTLFSQSPEDRAVSQFHAPAGSQTVGGLRRARRLATKP